MQPVSSSLQHVGSSSLTSYQTRAPYIRSFSPNRRTTREVLSSVQSLSRVRLFVTPGTTAHQASLSITNSQSPPRPMSIESVMPSNHLMLCHPLLFPFSIFPSIRVFSNESAVCIRWPKYWSFSFNISPSLGFKKKKGFAEIVRGALGFSGMSHRLLAWPYSKPISTPACNALACLFSHAHSGSAAP